MLQFVSSEEAQNIAPSEDRTHDLEIMRLARCLLRYRGLNIKENLINKFLLKNNSILIETN